MINIRILLIAVLVSYGVIHPTVPYVDPQTGENLWRLADREGTALDYTINQDIAITATVDNIFLLVQDIGAETDAITVTLATVVTDLGIITATLNAIYPIIQEVAVDTDLLLVDLGIITATLNNTYQEVVNCCPCTYFISLADLPITMTAAGTYCLTEDINGSIGATPIRIMGTDITFDLQGHTIYNAPVNAIIVDGPSARIRIKNGTVNAISNGIILDTVGNNTDVVIENMVAVGCNIGFLGTGSYQEIQYLHCIAKNCTSYGFIFETTVNPPSLNPIVVYDACSGFNNGLDGFAFFTLNSNTYSCTLTNCQSEANGRIGYNVIPNTLSVIPNISMFNCMALRNGQCGFSVKGVNGVCFRCIATNNGAAGLPLTDPSVGAGFYLPATSGDITLMSCIAINNSYSGFTDRNTTTTNPNRFFNNYAIRNRAGTLNYDLAGGVSQSVVVTTTNLTANNNLSWWVNMDGGQ